ncbi:hypothetical protein GCM10023143_19390 [Compostibacter hankyongensis]|uniref:T9SS type A sorting domain-containing protein n=1 Tax=Compostibacter hankyongensis TaxID=1007089 RepID=A0ABP8FUA3_9BACT
MTAAYNPAQQVVNLRWSTVLEKNNERFIVERSVDSLHFSSIGETRSAGNTETAQHYYFDDPKPIGGTLYYRLREVDADGKEYLSEVVNTSKPITQLEMTSVRLGEDHTTANLEIAAPGTVSASLILADVKGKVLKTFQLSLQRGTVFKSFYVGDLKAGVYFLQLNDHSGGKALLKKFSMD